MSQPHRQEPSNGEVLTVADRIRRSQESLGPAELKLSRALLANYPAAGLESTNALAHKVGISAPTVLRFVSRIGFHKYRDFQDALRAEVQARRASPLTLPARITAESATSELSVAVTDVATTGIRHTFHSLPEHEFERAVSLLCDPNNRIVSFGGRFSHVLAKYLDLHLRLMRPQTAVHMPDPLTNPMLLTDIGRRSVCIVFDVRRYEKTTIELAHAAKLHGARIVLITDPWLSPAADVADVVLPARVEAAGAFDSLVAPTALVEALVFAVHARLGHSADQRMRRIESAYGDLTID